MQLMRSISGLLSSFNWSRLLLIVFTSLTSYRQARVSREASQRATKHRGNNPMSKKAAEHHKQSQEHHPHAARHHGEAAKAVFYTI